MEATILLCTNPLRRSVAPSLLRNSLSGHGISVSYRSTIYAFSDNHIRHDGDSLYSAAVADALDSLGFPNQSPRLQFEPITGCTKLVGRCKTTLWLEFAYEEPDSYDLELQAVDSCQQDDDVICAAGGSVRAAVWGELLSTAAKNAGCVGAVVDGTVRDVAKMTDMGFPVFARGRYVYDAMHRLKVVDLDVEVEISGVRLRVGVCMSSPSRSVSSRAS